MGVCVWSGETVLFDIWHFNSLLRKHTFPLLVTTTQRLHTNTPWLQKMPMPREPGIFFEEGR